MYVSLHFYCHWNLRIIISPLPVKTFQPRLVERSLHIRAWGKKSVTTLIMCWRAFAMITFLSKLHTDYRDVWYLILIFKTLKACYIVYKLVVFLIVFEVSSTKWDAFYKSHCGNFYPSDSEKKQMRFWDYWNNLMHKLKPLLIRLKSSLQNWDNKQSWLVWYWNYSSL